MIHRNVPLPTVSALTLSGEPLPDFRLAVGGTGIECLPAMAVWRKLIEGSFPEEPVVNLILTGRAKDVRAVFPPSRWPTTALLSTSSEWAGLIKEPNPFAVVKEGSIARLMVVGRVTDPLWDEFEAAAGY